MNFLQAQEYTFNTNHYGVEDGLLGRNVRCVFEDKNGLIWLGFDDGLQSFDGSSFRTWTDEKQDLLKNVYNIFQDDEGWLWILNYRGNKILFLKPETGKILTVEERFGDSWPIDNNEFHSYSQWRFSSNSKGQLVFLAKNPHRLIFYHPSSGFKVVPFDANQERNIRLEYIDEFDIIWLTEISRNSIYGPKWIILNPNGSPMTTLDVRNELNLNHLPSALQEKLKKNINHLLHQQEPQLIFDSLYWNLNDKGWQIYRDINQTELLATLDRKSNNKRFFFQPELEDSSGRLWIISEWGLANINLKENLFEKILSFPDNKKPFNNGVRGILSDGEYIYANFENTGLLKINKNNTSDYKILDSNPDGKYTGKPIIKDQDGNLIVGHEESQLRIINPQTGNKQYIFNNKNDTIGHPYIPWSLYKAQDDVIWIGLDGGMSKFNAGGKELNYIFPNLDIYQHYSIIEITDINPVTNNQLLLLGGPTIYLFDIKKEKYIAKYGKEEKGEYYLPASYFHHLLIDKDSIYWLATNDGLLRWDLKTQEKNLFTKNEGLSSNLIYTILEDDYNHLWLASIYGLMRFSKDTYQVQSFLESDGIAQNEFNRTSYAKAEDGELFFGGVNGITALYPKKFLTEKSESYSKLMLTNVEVYNGKLRQTINKTTQLYETNQLILKPGDEFFQIDFSLINYDEASKNSFAWMIEGLGQDWHFQKENSLKFGNLPYGNFTLIIKGRNHYGQWGNEELSYSIKVLKPFYLQWWFILLVIAGILLAIRFYFHFNHKKLLRQKEQLQIEIGRATKKIQEQTTALKKLDELKSTFFTNINHELRTPLSLIMGPVSHLLDQIKDPAQKEMLEMINRNVQRQLLLVNQLLDLSKLDANKLQLKAREADIVFLLKSTFYAYESLAVKKNIKLGFRTNEKYIPLYFQKDLMENILYNIFTNAFKFTDQNGEINLDVQKKDKQVFITLTDTGIGIDKEKLPFIFDRFYQAGNAGFNNSPGSGIGLSLVKELVELHKGSIEIESDTGKGTMVKLSFLIGKDHLSEQEIVDTEIPQDEDENNFNPELEFVVNTENPVQTTTDDTKPRILVIEDNEDVRTLINRILEVDYNIINAVDGEEGLAKAKAEIPDLIISDVMMPKFDGTQVCEILKTDIQTCHIPIILLTAKASREEKIEGLETGADDYIFKPFDAKEVITRVKNLLHNRMLLRERFASTLILKPSEVTVNSLDQVFLETAMEIIENNMDNESFSIDQLSNELNMSKPNLNRKFRALVNKSSNQFIQSVKLQRAHDLLSQNACTVAEAAFQTGFNSTSYFVKCFKDQYGITPGNLLETKE